MTKIILASQSPRRQELLKRVVSGFEIHVADIDETVPAGMLPVDYVQKMALEKAEIIAAEYSEGLVIGSDTIVTIDDEIIGKPVSRAHAFSILQKLSGRTHLVYTAVAVIGKEQTNTLLVPAEVEFYPLSVEEINHYLDTGEYRDKAGAYGIQEQGSLLVKGIKGDYYAIMGLPIAPLARLLKENYKNVRGVRG